MFIIDNLYRDEFQTVPAIAKSLDFSLTEYYIQT